LAEARTATPEQWAILQKFVLPLADSYFDDIRHEYSQHHPDRAQIAIFFCNNLRSALQVASIPFQLCYARVTQRAFEAILTSERIRALKKVEPSPNASLTEALEKEAFEIANARFQKELATEQTMQRLTDSTIHNLGHFLSRPDGRIAGPELLSQTLVMVWAALEVLVSDVIRHEMNVDPSLAIRVATTDPSRKHFSNRISLEQLASRKFNLERSMGDALLADRSLDSLPVIRDVLNAIVADDAPVHRTFAGVELWKLWQMRHLIVHRRGLVDQAYIDRTGDTRWSVGSQIQLDAPSITAATDLVHNAAMVFLQCWRNLRPYSKSAT